jgi:hypothetical protein
MKREEICKAIESQNIISFHYSRGKDPGIRFVEPHMVAYNKTDHLCLSAWFLRGHSASKEKPGFREYWMEYISDIKIIKETFQGPREGYVPTGGKVFHNVQCGL